MGVALLIIVIGGVMMGIRTTFDPLLGSQRLIFAFEAVIIGGMGSGWGTLLGGVILGLAQTLGAQAFGAAWSIFVGHAVFVIVLVFRPQGLLAKTVLKKRWRHEQRRNHHSIGRQAVPYRSRTAPT